MMAEYYALSMSLREVLPLRDLVECMSTWSGLGSSVTTNFKVLCWEDNEGAWTLANLDPGQHTPRSKFYDSKVHWFRSYLSPETNPRGLKFEIRKVASAENIADLYTKSLPPESFHRLRELLMGW